MQTSVPWSFLVLRAWPGGTEEAGQSLGHSAREGCPCSPIAGFCVVGGSSGVAPGWRRKHSPPGTRAKGREKCPDLMPFQGGEERSWYVSCREICVVATPEVFKMRPKDVEGKGQICVLTVKLPGGHVSGQWAQR